MNLFSFPILGIIIYGLIVLVLMSFVAIKAVLFPTERVKTTTTDSADGWVLLLGYLLPFTLFAGGYVLDKFRDSFFPKTAFLIGQEKKRYEDDDKWRWRIMAVLIGTLFLPLIGWIVSLIFRGLS